MDAKEYRRRFKAATYVELIRDLARRRPDFSAYRHLVDGESREETLSALELDRRARVFAALLAERHAAGDRVILLMPTGLDYLVAFMGCLYAGVIAVPAYPPRAQRMLQDENFHRLRKIIEDTEARSAVIHARLCERVRANTADLPDLSGLNWILIDEVKWTGEAAWIEPALDPQTIAFLQYSSGSTGTPKGVMVTHGNLLHHMAANHEGNALRGDVNVVTWLPLYHDMGLIANALQAPFSEFTACIMSPFLVIQRPFRWLHAITRLRVPFTAGPNFAFDLCTQRITEDELQQLDLSCLELTVSSAEPVRRDTLERFADRFESVGFRRESFHPVYGLAEATCALTWPTPALRFPAVVKSATVDGDPGAERVLLGHGQSLLGQETIVVDPERREILPDGEVGEIWTHGPSVAAGYWNRPEETRETFGAMLADQSRDGATFMRTGDLGFFVDGELFITGRAKDLIIIRGKNYYPQDIEETVEGAHELIQPAGSAAFSIERDDEEKLVIVCEARRHVRPSGEGAREMMEDMLSAVLDAVFERHGLRPAVIALIRVHTLPKTTSGKVRRRRTREMFLNGELEAFSIREDRPTLSV